jgi:hypothetical protein
LKVALEALNQACQAYFEFGARGSSLYRAGELVLLGDQLPMFAIYLTQGQQQCVATSCLHDLTSSGSRGKRMTMSICDYREVSMENVSD